MRMHISQSTKDLLPLEYVVKERGEMQVKSKGELMRTGSSGNGNSELIGNVVLSNFRQALTFNYLG